MAQSTKRTGNFGSGEGSGGVSKVMGREMMEREIQGSKVMEGFEGQNKEFVLDGGMQMAAKSGIMWSEW